MYEQRNNRHHTFRLFSLCSLPAPLREPAVISRLDPSDIDRQRSDATRERVWILGAHGYFLDDVRAGKPTEMKLPCWQ